jgi:hypothetical protein
MKSILIVTIISLFCLLYADESYQVAFETTECSGDLGFATVEIKNIDRIESAECRHEGKKLQKLLVRRRGSYVTYTLTHDEAREIMKDVRLYNRARLQMMQNANAVVITK